MKCEQSFSRRLTLYWKPLEEYEENGDGFRYVLVELDRNANTRHKEGIDQQHDKLYTLKFDLVKIYNAFSIAL